MFNALVWGVSWWPLRELQALGVHPLWATALIFLFAVACVPLARPQAWRGLLRHPALWILLLACGLTNVGFNWAVTIGDVVRVVLLFYLMPGWSMLLAWGLLGERPTRASLLRLLLSFAGLLIVLLPPGLQFHGRLLDFSAADLLALLGGFSFALTSVMLRRLSDTPGEARMLAMFGGGAVMALAVAAAGVSSGIIAPLPPLALRWAMPALLLALAFMGGNLALQYAAQRLSAATMALVMLTEVVFAGVSSVLFGGAVLETRTLLGGSLIVLAALLASATELRH